jgi:hypothetical protein
MKCICGFNDDNLNEQDRFKELNLYVTIKDEDIDIDVYCRDIRKNEYVRKEFMSLYMSSMWYCKSNIN